MSYRIDIDIAIFRQYRIEIKMPLDHYYPTRYDTMIDFPIINQCKSQTPYSKDPD